jgi:hypothetical protein
MERVAKSRVSESIIRGLKKLKKFSKTCVKGGTLPQNVTAYERVFSLHPLNGDKP